MISLQNQWTTQAHVALFALASLSACANVFDAGSLDFNEGGATPKACIDSREPQINAFCEVATDCEAPLKCTETGFNFGLCFKPCVDDRQCGEIDGACVTEGELLTIYFGHACTNSQEAQSNEPCDFSGDDIDCEAPLLCTSTDVESDVGQCIKNCVTDRQCGGVGNCVPEKEVLRSTDSVQGFCEEPFFNDDDQIPCDNDTDCEAFAPPDLRLICERGNRLCHRTCTEDAECLEDTCIRIPNSPP